MSKDVIIRQAQDNDLPAVLSLYAQADMDRGQVLTLQRAQSIFEQFKTYPNYRLFIALDNSDTNVVLGTYALLIMHNLAHQGTSSAIVEDVVVKQSHQGQGIGRTMMLHAMELAKLAQCYKLVLSSNRKRQNAHAFYRSLGFQEHGVSFHVNIDSKDPTK
jgi:ribosomal protein S18 acetylase RimI-like enzyme